MIGVLADRTHGRLQNGNRGARIAFDLAAAVRMPAESVREIPQGVIPTACVVFPAA